MEIKGCMRGIKLQSEIGYRFSSRCGGVVVSVIATGPKGRGSNPAEAMDF
jgi:hypothetical protein